MFGRIFRRKRSAADFGDELQAHIRLEEECLRERGLSPEEAHSRAHRAFGNVTHTQEGFYESRHWVILDQLWNDVRYAARVLRKSPSFAIAAILTLAMAIGANVVVFSVTNALFLRPLNLPDEQRIYLVEHAADRSRPHSYPNYVDLRDRNQSFDGLATFSVVGVGLATGQNGQSPTLNWGWEVSGNYFDVLRIRPYLGRFFHASDEHGRNSAPYIVLSYSYWHNHFRDDPDAVGRSVRLNKHPFTIIGVTPPEFHGTVPFVAADFYAPQIDQQDIEGVNNLEARGVGSVQVVVGRLKAGVTPAQATADLNSIGAYLQKTYPNDDQEMAFTIEHIGAFGSDQDAAQGTEAFLGALMLLAGLILLAACANLGSLFSARAADRSREIAVRLALGSSRARVLRQFFTEATLISLAGGVVGLWSSSVLLQWLSGWHPVPRYPVQAAVNPDFNVYALALLLALVSGLLFGAVPVRQVLETNPYGVIKSGSTGKTRGRITVRELLLTVQIALCAVLVTSSFVAVRGLIRSMHNSLGVDPRNVMLVDVDMNTAGYRGADVPPVQKRVIEAMHTIPGVQAAAWTNVPPLTLDCCATSQIFTDQTANLTPANAAIRATTFRVSLEYFQVTHTALLSGREFTWNDDKTAPRVAVVNQRFARRVFGSVNSALGSDFKLGDGTRIQVVGVIEDGKYGSTTEGPHEAMFLPILQAPSDDAWLLVQSPRDSQQLASAIRSKLNDVDPSFVAFFQTWNQGLEGSAFGARMAAMSLGVLGIMGAILSVTGIFGMASYAVSKRKRELGIRMALGARSEEVVRAALGPAVKLLFFGSAAGLLLGFLASRVLAAIVYEATPRDPLVLAGVVLAMALVGLLATWIPAQRALAIDPAMLLREE